MSMVEENEILTARIRALQAMFWDAHAALREWGAWSMDRRGIYPVLSPPSVWDQFKRSEVEDYGEETDHAQVVTTPVKAEGPDHEVYDEKLAVLLDERIHGPGGMPLHQREAIRLAYATREVPEYQFPRFAGCNLDAFCERLEGALVFVGRFI